MAYAKKDSLVQVHTNNEFVGVMENHNIALRLISPKSNYCKVVCADDWIFRECLMEMVELAEGNPTVGIVGSYANKADGVRWLGLPHDTSVFSGREVSRLYLLGAIDFFGTPSAVLYRSALVRCGSPFFPGSTPNADTAACLNSLQVSDFGFVHQILSFETGHEKAVNTEFKRFNSFLVDRLDFLVKYGSIYLSSEEYKKRLEELLSIYYEYLAVGIVNFWDSEFWHYHKDRMNEIGVEFDYTRLAKATLEKLLDLFFHPKLTIEKIVRRLRGNRNRSGCKGLIGDR